MESKAKEILHSKTLNQSEKLIAVVYLLNKEACSIAEIRTKARNLGLTSAVKWNVSGILSKTKPYVVKTDLGWEITESGKTHASKVLGLDRRTIEMASSLRHFLKKIENPDTALFLKEAIECYERKFYRAAVVLSWTGAMNVLYEHTFKKHLVNFNQECIKHGWKQIKNMDDFGLITEFHFLNAIEKISILNKNVREELQNLCLKLRNGCAHPNSMTIGESRIITHFELLINHIFLKF